MSSTKQPNARDAETTSSPRNESSTVSAASDDPTPHQAAAITQTRPGEKPSASGTESRTGSGTQSGPSGSGTGSGSGSGSGGGMSHSDSSNGAATSRSGRKSQRKRRGERAAQPASAEPATFRMPEPGSNLFVAGLASTVDDEALRGAFAPHGRVVSAKVMLHVDTAASRGFGFVLFATSAEAERARESMHGTAIAGHGGRLQVSVSKHRGENLSAESRVVYIRNLPECLLGSDELAAFLGGFGPVNRVTSRPGGSYVHPGGAPSCTNAVVTFGSVDAARACVAACHGKTPFAQCAVPLLSKMEEPQTLREQRLREQRSLRSETVPVADAEAPHVAVSLPHAPPPSSRATDTDPAQPAVRAAPTWPPAGLSPLPPFSTTGGPPFPPVPPLANQQQTLTASMANAPPRAPVPFPYSTLPPPPPPHPYAAMMTYHSAAVAAPGAAALPPFGILAYPGGAMPMAPFFHPPHLPQVPGRPF